MGRMKWFLALLSLIPLAALAGPNRWTTSGPEGVVIMQIVTDPENARVAYAVGAGISRTSDGGESWNPVNDGLPKTYVSAFFVIPDDPSTLFTAIDGTIYISEDAGQHWAERARLGSLYIQAFAFDTDSRTLYAATSADIFVSRDRGQTWELSSTPLNLRVVSVAVAPGGMAYALGIRYGNQGNDRLLFRTADHGHTWTTADKLPLDIDGSFETNRVVIDRDSSTLYLMATYSVFQSTDDAGSWRSLPMASSKFTVRFRSIVPAGSGRLYASTDRGVYLYDDRAHAWTEVGRALSNAATGALAVTASNPRRLYAAPEFGIVTSVEGQTDWMPSTRGLPGAYASDVAVATGEVAYTAAGPGIFKTDDGGASWRLVETSRWPSHVAVSPDAPDTVYAGVNGVNPGVLKTTTGGATWKTVEPHFASALAVAPSNSATLYAALTTAMSKSIDGGQSWVPVMSGIPLDYYDFYYGFSANAIAVSPSDASTVYISKYSGLYKTTDGGAHWGQASDLSVSTIAIDAADPSIIFAARDGVFRSNDGAKTFVKVGLINKFVRTLAVVKSLLFAGTDDGHVYRSRDGGEHWTGFDDGLARSPVSQLAVDSSGEHFYAATSAGVYQYQLIPDDLNIDKLAGDPLLRLAKLLNAASPDHGFALPILGTANGADGLFTSEVTLTNEGDSDRNLLLTWLPQGGGSERAVSFHLTLPPSSHTFDLERFGVTGLGSLVVMAVNAGGELDPNASISGSARIWLDPSDGRAPLSQVIPTARSAFGDHTRAETKHLQHDAAFRTNAGIVNLSGEWHQFTVQVNGERTSRQFTIAVPPFSLIQTPIPEDNYGVLSLVVDADSSPRWLLYGSTIDRVSGEARTVGGN